MGKFKAGDKVRVSEGVPVTVLSWPEADSGPFVTSQDLGGDASIVAVDIAECVIVESINGKVRHVGSNLGSEDPWHAPVEAGDLLAVSAKEEA